MAMNDDDRLQAVLARDKHRDGHFYYGVASTGIYCRPSCPSRRPRPINMRFFPTCEEAERAGFRPCKRCCPKDTLAISGRRPLEMPAMERRLAAIMSADVANYSRLMGEDEEGTYVALKNHRESLIDPTIGARRGRVVKSTGDGLLVEFASVTDAVQCAASIQQGIAARNRGLRSDRRLEFRIGVNLAEIIVEPDDIYGDGVNIADRLQSLSPVGGVCVSQAVHDQICGKLPFGFDDLGEQRVKNIARPIRAFSVRFVGSPTRDDNVLKLFPASAA
jgi:class 3 adenylate cyclase